MTPIKYFLEGIEILSWLGIFSTLNYIIYTENPTPVGVFCVFSFSAFFSGLTYAIIRLNETDLD